jgi:bacteriorhodopsin
MLNSDVEKFVVDDEKEKKEKKANPVQYYVKFSFMITYVLLLTTATITFIEAIRTPIPFVRHVLNLETCISVVAGYFYSVFVNQIDQFSKEGKNIDWADITKTRYIDWSITTPMMLLTLCIVLGQNIKQEVHFVTILSIIVLNYIMLFFGYLGENETISKIVAMFIGFVAFFSMFYLIYIHFVKPKYLFANYILYALYLVIWMFYGFVYMLNEEYKNISMNILDFTAKCFIGLGLWAYYTKIIRP